MRDDEKQARREIERSTIFGEVLEQLDRDASGDELYDALVARGYWNEEEREALIQKECVRQVQELLDEIAREGEPQIDLLLARNKPQGQRDRGRRRTRDDLGPQHRRPPDFLEERGTSGTVHPRARSRL